MNNQNINFQKFEVVLKKVIVNNKLKIIDKTIFIIGICFILIQAILNIVFIPLQEFPDAQYHFNKILKNSGINFYYYIQKIFFLDFSNTDNYILNKLYIIGSNRSLYLYNEFRLSEFLSGQVINLCILFIFIVLFTIVISSNKNIKRERKQKLLRLTLLFFSWPQINYYITNLSSDFLIILYQPLFIYFILNKKRVVNLFLMLFLLKYVDNNVFTNIIFFLSYYSIEILFMEKGYLKIKKYKLTILMFIGLGIVYILINSSLLESYFPEIYYHKEFNYFVGSRSWIRRIAALILSSLYLSGSMSFMLPKFIYLLYLVLLLKVFSYILFINDKNQDQLFVFVVTSIASIGVTLIIIPTLGQLKYYTFIIFFILEGINKLLYKSQDVVLKRNYIGILVISLSITLYMVLKIVNNIYF